MYYYEINKWLFYDFSSNNIFYLQELAASEADEKVLDPSFRWLEAQQPPLEVFDMASFFVHVIIFFLRETEIKTNHF